MPKLNTESQQPKTAGDMRNSNTLMQLLSFVERLERLDEEKQAMAADMREVMSEAKDVGFDTKTLRKVLARRKMDTADRVEADSLLDIYEQAIREAEKKQLAASEQAAS